VAQERLSMRRVFLVLRLSAEGLSARQISLSLGVARSTVAECLRRAAAAGIGWPPPPELDETMLERRLYPPSKVRADARPAVDWAALHTELRRKGVTLFLLHQEHKETFPDGFQYSRFCQLYRIWAGKIDVVMRQDHRAGEKVFVDYSGLTIDIIDRRTGEIRAAEIFVGVLGASCYTYAEATWTQTLPDWLGSHVRMLNFFGCSPEVCVPDNLKSGVTKPHRYEPYINASYQDLLDHYTIAVIPAHVRKPKQKSRVEAGVLLAQRWILARLRNTPLFSLDQANREIATLLHALNRRPFKKLPGTRLSQFETIDRPAMRPLPATPYEYAEWKRARVQINYHVQVEWHFYSVPYTLVSEEIDVRYTATTVECLHRGNRVASHVRSFVRNGYTTVAAHMPESHRSHAEWTPERLVHWAARSGPATARAAEAILARRQHPQQNFRSVQGVMRLGKTYGDVRLEAACQRALSIGTCSYISIESILKKGLDKQALPQQITLSLPVEHDNVRGPDYYQ
jgi:transposase